MQKNNCFKTNFKTPVDLKKKLVDLCFVPTKNLLKIGDYNCLNKKLQ